MKKFLDEKQTIVADMLEGYSKVYPARVRLEGSNILYRRQLKAADKVPVIIGNGSGHEPAMIDLVGEGLLDANICGRIFSSPPPLDILKGMRTVYQGNPVLLLVSSHPGDILNAKMSLMLAKAESIDARMVILWDDISSAPRGKEQERRGTAGLFFTFKIVCAAAEQGWDIDRLVALAQKVRDRTRTLSVAASTGTNPETGLGAFSIPDDEIEVGMGVHGEAGSGRVKLSTADEIVMMMSKKLIEDLPFVCGDKIFILLNNSGATTRMELMILYRDIERFLGKAGIEVLRCWVGTYVTTQESAGFSLSLCKADQEMVDLYDAYADSPLFQGERH